MGIAPKSTVSTAHTKSTKSRYNAFIENRGTTSFRYSDSESTDIRIYRSDQVVAAESRTEAGHFSLIQSLNPPH